MRHAQLCSTLLLALVFTACGEESDSAPSPSAPDAVTDTDTSGTDTIASDATEDTVEITGCPAGQILSADSTCTTVGIPGCAEVFMSPDSGFCEPRIGLCDAGYYPDFETGCVQAGITECAAEFVDSQSGLCVPEPDACEAGFVPLPTQGCVSLDPPEGCGAGTWGGIVEADGDQHVDQAYEGGDSNGSREKPWTQISQALSNLGAQGRIVLAAGDYNESVFLQSSASLIGRCSSMVTISGAKTNPLAANLGDTVLEFAGAINVTVRDLRVSGDGIGLATYLGAQVNLERVIFENNEFFGIFMNGAGTTVNASTLVVNGTRPRTSAGGFGWGISTQDGAALTLDGAMLFGNNDTNLLCGGSPGSPPSSLSATDVLLSQAKSVSLELGGYGLSLNTGATATLNQVVIHENPNGGLFLTGAGTSANVDQMVVIGPNAENSKQVARGVNIQSEAIATLNQVAIYRAEDIGLYIANEGTNVETQGLFIAETQQTSPTMYGRGIHVRDNASLSLNGGALISNHDSGFVIRDGATAVATGLLVEDTQTNIDGFRGTGIEALTGAQVVLERTALMHNMEAGLVAIMSPTMVELRDSVIAHTQKASDGMYGRGVHNQFDASMIVERTAIIDNYQAALFMFEAYGEIRDTLLSDTKMSGPDALAGDGLLVILSDVTASGVAATRNDRAGILYDRTAGSISKCSITENAFGIATQGTDVPTISDDNDILDNDKNIVENSALAIPDTPMEVPVDETSNQ